MLKVLFASSEIYPFAKSGGLADVADALPNALKKEIDICRVMPLYSFINSDDFIEDGSFDIELGGVGYSIELYYLEQDDITTYFIKAPLLSSTDGLYGDALGDYANNDLRFAIFSMAIVELAVRLEVNTLHLNDWHTALAALFIRERYLEIRTIFTIHNLAYQGVFERESMSRVGIDNRYFTMDGVEFYSKVNFLKAGIAYSDAITTVSPSYAKEIMTSEFGCGLDGFLEHHKDKISGILNGINTTIFNSKDDERLIFPFDIDSLDKKHKNKVEFIKNSKLKDPRKPLFVMVTRLVEQKGMNLIITSLKSILDKKINFFILGEGRVKYVEKLEKFSKEYPNFEFIQGYDETLSHRTYAAADFIIMPSLFEPCGLNQMIAMKYATIPLVYSVGGLRDSVVDEESGIVFEKYTKKEFLLSIDRAIKLKKDKKRLHLMLRLNIESDLSCHHSALEYIKIYKKDRDV